MKIVLVNSVCGYGSTGRIMVDLAKTYMQEGHQCILAYGRGEVSEDVKKRMENEYPGQCVFYRIGGKFAKVNNYIHGFESRLLDNHGFSSQIATRQFIEWLQKEKPDVIHLHNLHGYYINVEMLFQYIKRSNIKVLWTLHDCWSFTGHCSHYDYVKCEKWKTECHHCPQKKEYPSSILMERANWNYEKKKMIFSGVKNLTIVTPSKWLKDQVKQSFLKDYPVAVIQNGIDVSVFSTTQLSQYEDKKQKQYREKKSTQYVVLGVASVWTDKKGIKYFASLAKHLPDKYEIVLIGLTVKQLKRLESRKKEKSYLKKITGILRTDSVEGLAEYYREADVFVNPTLEEVLGLVNIEALSCGTPVVTFDTGGSPETVCDSREDVSERTQSCGAIVAKGNAKQLCLEVRRICEMDEEKKAQLRLRCVKRAQDYKKEERYKDYLKML